MTGVGVLLSLLVLAGCGGGSDGGGSTSSSTAADTPSTSTTSSDSATAKVVTELETRPTQIPVSTPIDKPIPSGKKIDYIMCTPASCKTERDGFAAAAKVLGWKVKTIVAEASPEAIQAAFSQALRDRPDAIVSIGYSKSNYAPQYKQIVAAGIPMVAGFAGDQSNPADKFTVVYGPDTTTAQGKAYAQYVLGKNGGKVNVIEAVLSGFPSIASTVGAFDGEFKSLCPSCKIYRIDVPPTALGKDAPQRIANFARSKPDANALYVTLDGMATGLPQQLASVGRDNVKIFGTTPELTSFQYIKDGTETSAWASPIQDVGWQMADALARQMTGQSTKPSQVVTRIVWTKDNLPSDTSTIPPVVADVGQQYSKLWGK